MTCPSCPTDVTHCRVRDGGRSTFIQVGERVLEFWTSQLKGEEGVILYRWLGLTENSGEEDYEFEELLEEAIDGGLGEETAEHWVLLKEASKQYRSVVHGGEALVWISCVSR